MSTFEELHWLRPEWLLALLPAIIVVILLLRLQRNSNSWQQVIAPELLPHLLEGSFTPARKRGLIALLAAWLIACVALAGPVWEKIATPIHKKENALIILFDLSPSMLVEDIKPSRLVRARHKLIDLLRQRQEGLSALIAYAGEAHVVAPLTDDTATLESLLPALHPNIMPLRGSNPEMAVEKALALIEDAGVQSADILILSDEIADDAANSISKTLQGLPVRLSILGVGTQEGAPIPFGKGGFAKDNNGNIVIAALNRTRLEALSARLGGRYSDLRADNQDIEWLSDLPDDQNEQTRLIQREFDNWHEYGHWLALLLLPVIAYCFRRGVLLSLLIIPMSTLPAKSQAMSWDDLWYTKDQQGKRSLEQGDAKNAAQQFDNQRWKGTAQYQSGDYDAAVESFGQGDNAQDHYNRGNALARAGKLDEAIEAYDSALEQLAEFEDAQFNRDLVEKLKQEQEKQEQQQDQNQDQDQDQDQNQDQDQDQQGQNQENEGQQDPSQQDGSESEQEQQGENKEGESEKEQQARNEKEQADREAQQAEEQAEGQTEEQTEGQNEQAAEESELDSEQQQALEQWLRQVPDDPGGLLRRKFQYQHRQLRKDYQRGDWQPPENSANQRW